MYRNFYVILFLGLISISGFIPANAQTEPVWERFSEFDATSKITINHSPLSDILRQTVFPLGKSKSLMGAKANVGTGYTGTRIRRGGSGAGVPSRYENNRLMLHAFSDEHKNFYIAYQKGLENLSNRRPLRELNKNEQLAFWLNLHNVIVINKLVEEYPISKLKSLRSKKRGKSFWDEKVTTVEGVPLSLIDIENIIYHNFDKPDVIYGLFQGAIGGPKLPTRAFEGNTVWKMLEDTGIEFVNSNRGVRPKGNIIEVSKFFEWSKLAFGNSDAAVLDHIQEFANYSFLGDISSVQSLKYKQYNWKITDLLGGNLHGGTTPNYAAFLSNHNSMGAEGGEFGETQLGSSDFTGWLMENTPKGFSLENLIPPNAFELITKAMENNDIPFRVPVITTVECEPGDPCEEVDFDG